MKQESQAFESYRNNINAGAFIAENNFEVIFTCVIHFVEC